LSEQFNQSEDEISLQEYIQIIRKRKWTIFWVLVIAILIVFLANYIMTPVYKASTTVLLSEKSSAGQLFGNPEMDLMFGGSNNIETQVEIIKSRTIASEVVKKLPSDIFQQAEEENFQKRKDELRWLINILDFLRLKGFVSNMLGVDSTGNPEPEEQLTEEKKIKKVMNSISVNLVKNTKIIEISTENIHPKLAADIANKTAQVYVEQSRNINRTQASEAKKFIEEQLSAQEKELKSIEEEKLAFKQRENILYLDEETKLNIEQLSNFQAQKLEIDTQLVESKARLAEIKKQLEEQTKTVVSSQTITANPVVQQLQSKLTDLQIQLPALKEKYSEKSPQVTEVEIQIKQIENEISQKVAEIVGSTVSTVNPIYQSLLSQMVTLETNMISLETKSNSISEIVTQYENRLEELPEKEIQLARLERAVRVAENIYITLLESYQEARISEAMELGDIRVVDAALVPDNPIKPRKMLNLAIGGVLGLMLGIMLVFFLEFLDHSFKSREDVEQYLELPVLGTIPYAEINQETRKRKSKKKKSKSQT
jgi:polysaccharide chain length determinant protein (PEP-CTERM system associated)